MDYKQTSAKLKPWLVKFFHRLVFQLHIFWFTFQYFRSLFGIVEDLQQMNRRRNRGPMEVHGKAMLHTNFINFVQANEH